MQCPVCKDAQGKSTGSLELVSAISVSVTADGTINRNSAMLLDEYLACNNCTDLSCDAEDCVIWFWEQSGTERHIVLGSLPTASPSVTTAVVEKLG